MRYGVVAREDNLNADGIGIGGGVSAGPDGYPGHVTIYRSDMLRSWDLAAWAP